MENTPTVCADDLPSILGISRKYPKSRSVNIFSSGWISLCRPGPEQDVFRYAACYSYTGLGGALRDF